MNDNDYDFGFEDDQQLLQQMEEEQLRELDEMEPLRLPDAMLFDPFDPFDDEDFDFDPDCWNRPKSLPCKGLGRRGRGRIVVSPCVPMVYVDIKKTL